jgi:hypothetical protein
MTNKYFKWIQKETSICKVFQSYIEDKRNCKTYLTLRENKQAPVDFLGRFYDKKTYKTIVEVALEVRSLEFCVNSIKNWLWFIYFPISKLNELMKFWRMWKECYIVYLLKDKVHFLSWDYYLKHNFEIWNTNKWVFIKLPIDSFMECWEYKKEKN